MCRVLAQYNRQASNLHRVHVALTCRFALSYDCTKLGKLVPGNPSRKITFLPFRQRCIASRLPTNRNINGLSLPESFNTIIISLYIGYLFQLLSNIFQVEMLNLAMPSIPGLDRLLQTQAMRFSLGMKRPSHYLPLIFLRLPTVAVLLAYSM